VAKRIDQRDERKRKLEALKREQQRKEQRKTRLTIAISTLAGLALVGAVVVPSVNKSRKEAADKKKLEAEAKNPMANFGVKLADAACLDEKVDNPIPEGNQHVNPGVTVEYPVIPPDGGKHTAGQTVAIDAGFYARDADVVIEHAVHDLEHGVVVGWYDKALPQAEVDALQKIGASATNKKLRFVAIPWDRDNFPDDKHFVLTSWGHTQRCGKVSGEAIDAFVKKNQDSKVAPEAGGRV
jgi:hypothetical protein